MSYRIIVSIFFLFFIIFGCSSSNEVPIQQHRDDLIVIEGARDLKYYNFHGTEQVAYRVDLAYPAGKALVDICEKLKERGWEPLAESFLNPGLPSSHVTGWSWFEDGTKPSNPWIYQWLADWKNNNGDILSFALRYETTNKKAILLENNNLHIYGIYMTASLAEEGRKLKPPKPPSSKEPKQ